MTIDKERSVEKESGYERFLKLKEEVMGREAGVDRAADRVWKMMKAPERKVVVASMVAAVKGAVENIEEDGEVVTVEEVCGLDVMDGGAMAVAGGGVAKEFRRAVERMGAWARKLGVEMMGGEARLAEEALIELAKGNGDAVRLILMALARG